MGTISAILLSFMMIGQPQQNMLMLYSSNSSSCETDLRMAETIIQNMGYTITSSSCVQVE
jgi:hypothetical protein